HEQPDVGLLVLHPRWLQHARGQLLRELGDPCDHQLTHDPTFLREVAMWRRTLIIACSLAVTPLVFAGHEGDSTIWVTDLKGEIDSAWVPMFLGGPSDFFNTAHTVLPGLGNSEDLVDGLPITGIAVSVADFGTTLRYPMVGVFYSNFGLDPSGLTPDLSQPISSVTSPVPDPPFLFA